MSVAWKIPARGQEGRERKSVERNRRDTHPPPTIDEYRIYCTPSIQNGWRPEKKGNTARNPGQRRRLSPSGGRQADGGASLASGSGECNNGVFKAGKTSAVRSVCSLEMGRPAHFALGKENRGGHADGGHDTGRGAEKKRHRAPACGPCRGEDERSVKRSASGKIPPWLAADAGGVSTACSQARKNRFCRVRGAKGRADLDRCERGGPKLRWNRPGGQSFPENVRTTARK